MDISKNRLDTNNQRSLLSIIFSGVPFLALTLLFIGLYLYPYFSPEIKPILDLTNIKWQVCFPQENNEQCLFRDTLVPKDIRRDQSNNFSGDIIYQVNFLTPHSCLNNRDGCSLYVSEVGDAAEIYLNNTQIGRHGRLPPKGIYAKHYPVRVLIPPVLFNKSKANELIFKVHSFKGVQAGIRRGPVALFTNEGAAQLNIYQIAQSIVIPLISAFIVFLVALISVCWSILRRELAADVKALIYYSASLSFFLFSLTELPREVMPVHLAGLIHHSARIFGDLMFFHLMRVAFFKDNVIFKIVKFIYWIFLLISPVMALVYMIQGTLDVYGFDNTYLVRRIAFPLLLLPHLMGIWGSYSLPRSIHKPILFLIFVFTTFCQIADSMVFHALTSGTYYVKAYPVLISLGMAYLIFYNRTIEALKEKSQLRARSIVGMLAAQVAHDIRSPLTALNLITGTLQNLPEEKRLIIRNATGRINDIANSLLQQSKNQQTIGDKQGAKPDQPKIAMLSSLVDTIVSEKRTQFREKAGVHIEADLNHSYGLFANVCSSDISRAISNLINNSVDAFTNATGVIKVSIRANGPMCEIVISDNGKGIPGEILSKLGAAGVTYGKSGTENGTGLGLYQTRQALEKVGGTLKIVSPKGEGTKVTMCLPKVVPPPWFVERIKIQEDSTLVSVDDDQSIHAIWSGRLASMGVDRNIKKHIIFTSLKQMENWFHSEQSVQDVNYFIDFEFINQKGTGLDLIEKLGIARKSILVTSRYDQDLVLKRCSALGVMLIPKGLAAIVPIEIEKSRLNEFTADIDHGANGLIEKRIVSNSKSSDDCSHKIKYDLCLIDDDTQLIHPIWFSVAESKGLKIKIFSTPQDFFSGSALIALDTPIYIDVSLADDISGIDVARDIHKLGFPNINLATGYEPDSVKAPSFIRSIVGKDFPL